MLATAFATLETHTLAGTVTGEAIVYLEQLFGSGPDAPGPTMAGRAEELVGDPANVSAAVAALASDLLAAPKRR